uniref:Family with sequence similarity 107 member A n=1 Tax=Eptatretus burgeri TaxID=7764 RepID=A0A8C4N249_EPTBU
MGSWLSRRLFVKRVNRENSITNNNCDEQSVPKGGHEDRISTESLAINSASLHDGGEECQVSSNVDTCAAPNTQLEVVGIDFECSGRCIPLDKELDSQSDEDLSVSCGAAKRQQLENFEETSEGSVTACGKPESKKPRPGFQPHSPDGPQNIEGDMAMYNPDYEDDMQGLIKPKKLPNPVKASRTHQDMHRELLMNCRRGVGVQSKPELLRMMEQRRREQEYQQRCESAQQRPPSVFEVELLKRKQRLDQLEMEKEQQTGGETQSEATTPEFLRIREKLRRTGNVDAEAV